MFAGPKLNALSAQDASGSEHPNYMVASILAPELTLNSRYRFWRAVRTQILPPLSLSPSDTASWDEGYSELSSPERQSSLNHSLRGRPKRQASTCSTTTKKGDEPIHVVVVDRNFKDLLGDHAGFTPSGRSSAEMEATTPAAEPPLSVLAAPPLFPTPSNSAVDLHGDVSCRPLRWSERSKHFLCTTVPEAVWHFFDPKFKDPKEERAYRRESWTMSKPQALTSAAFLSIAWIVTVATQARPFSTFVKVGYCAIGATSIAPIMPLVIVNAPRRSPWLWQFPLFVATWALPYVIVFDLWNCHFYIPGENRCPQKDFSALPSSSHLWALPWQAADLHCPQLASSTLHWHSPHLLSSCFTAAERFTQSG